MQITTEDFQRYLRIFLQWLASALVSYGFIKPEATWVTPAIGAVIAGGSFIWTMYGNRVQAKINEVAKLDVVASVKVTDKETAEKAPANVTATRGAT
jgi:hypothetical protein